MSDGSKRWLACIPVVLILLGTAVALALTPMFGTEGWMGWIPALLGVGVMTVVGVTIALWRRTKMREAGVILDAKSLSGQRRIFYARIAVAFAFLSIAYGLSRLPVTTSAPANEAIALWIIGTLFVLLGSSILWYVVRGARKDTDETEYRHHVYRSVTAYAALLLALAVVTFAGLGVLGRISLMLAWGGVILSFSLLTVVVWYRLARLPELS